MYLKDNGIFDLDSWQKTSPPMGKDKHWQDGRSAKELARYMTALPRELEQFLLPFTDADTTFTWRAEHVTEFAKYGLGRGEGRNHDAFLWSDHLVVGIEGKADEAFGSQYVRDAYVGGSENKQHRIDGMLRMLLGEGRSGADYPTLRYQLLTASAATLLEAREHRADTAVFLVMVFQKPGCFSEEKVQKNECDLDAFLSVTNAVDCGGYYRLETAFGHDHGIRFYFGKIVIDLPA